jgi:perosamine synthetase
VAELVPFHRPDITDAEVDAVTATMRSGWLTTGPRAKEFEERFATYLGVHHALACNSGTAALHLALDAIGLRPGDEVILPTYTFTASAEVVGYLGARPSLVDVRAADLNIDVAAVERALTSRTRAIIGVDIGGIPCDWDALRQLTSERAINLIDDAAHALPSVLLDRPIGRWADLTAFSFYATKTLTTGEGGMLVTDNAEWADRARMMSLHGISAGAWNRYSAEGSWYYEVQAVGFKYNMTDIAASLGLAQLGRLDSMTHRRTAIAEQYTAAFRELATLETPTQGPHRQSSWHLYLLRLNLEQLPYDRAEFINRLKSLGIGTSVHFIPLHLHPYYRNTYGFEASAFPIAYREYLRVVSLPIYSAMTDDQVERVINAVCTVARA